jgi:hypothetical protein
VASRGQPADKAGQAYHERSLHPFPGPVKKKDTGGCQGPAVLALTVAVSGNII